MFQTINKITLYLERNTLNGELAPRTSTRAIVARWCTCINQIIWHWTIAGPPQWYAKLWGPGQTPQKEKTCKTLANSNTYCPFAFPGLSHDVWSCSVTAVDSLDLHHLKSFWSDINSGHRTPTPPRHAPPAVPAVAAVAAVAAALVGAAVVVATAVVTPWNEGRRWGPAKNSVGGKGVEQLIYN